MMNLFRALGDLSHVASFYFLGRQLFAKRSMVGISRKTQELYLLVFLLRYLDLFTNFFSLYNTVMKIIFIVFTAGIVFLMHKPYTVLGISLDLPATYAPTEDTFIQVFAVGPSVALALLVNEFKGSIFSNFGHWLFEVCWASSIYLESIAILPQLIMLQRHNQVENITASYMASLGAYRGFYILNWVYRYYHEAHYSAWIPWVAGVVQTALYADFFYYFWLSKSRGMRHVILPMSK